MENHEQEIKDLEAKCVQAAEIGKDLLEKNQSLSKELEKINDENHKLQLKLNAKSQMEESWQEELEYLRNLVQSNEKVADNALQLEQENTELKTKVNHLRSKEKALEDRISTLESQIEDAINTSVHNLSVKANIDDNSEDNHEDSIMENLQKEHLELQQEKLNLEKVVSSSQLKVEELNHKVELDQQKINELQNSLQDKQSELNIYVEKVEQLRETIEDQTMEIEQLRVLSNAPGSKGNSIFSEVEDRRHIIEAKFKQMKVKYESMLVQFKAKDQQIKKLRLQNLNLLKNNSSSNKTSYEQLRKFQDLMEAEKYRIKLLNDSIKFLKGKSRNYSVLDANKYEKLEDKFGNLMRQSLADVLTIRDMTSKIYKLEYENQKQEQQNIQLKIELENKKDKEEDEKFKKLSNFSDKNEDKENLENKDPNSIETPQKTKSVSMLNKIDESISEYDNKEEFELSINEKFNNSKQIDKEPPVYSAKSVEDECKTQ